MATVDCALRYTSSSSSYYIVLRDRSFKNPTQESFFIKRCQKAPYYKRLFSPLLLLSYNYWC